MREQKPPDTELLHTEEELPLDVKDFIWILHAVYVIVWLVYCYHLSLYVYVMVS